MFIVEIVCIKGDYERRLITIKVKLQCKVFQTRWFWNLRLTFIIFEASSNYSKVQSKRIFLKLFQERQKVIF